MLFFVLGDTKNFIYFVILQTIITDKREMYGDSFINYNSVVTTACFIQPTVKTLNIFNKLLYNIIEDKGNQ